MERDKHILVLNDYEQRLIVNCLKTCRDSLIQKEFSVSDMDKIILKVIDAPTRKGRTNER